MCCFTSEMTGDEAKVPWLFRPALAASPPQDKVFTLITNVLDREVNEFKPQELQVTVATDEELDKLRKFHGGGSLVRVGQPGPRSATTTRAADVVNHATYTLVGGNNEAIAHHRTWTQSMDKALEVEACQAVRAAVTARLGELVEIHGGGGDGVLADAEGVKMEFDGVLVGAGTALMVEAKHTAHEKHVELVLEKMRFLERIVRQGAEEALRGVERVVPVLASRRFAEEVEESCRKVGVGVVKPSGAGFAFEHPVLTQ